PAALLLLPPPPSGTHTLSLHDALPIWVVEQCEQQMLDGHVLMALLAGALVALADAELQVLAEHWKASESCCGPRWGCPHAFPCQDRKSTRLNSSHVKISYAVFCLKKRR